MLEYCKKILNLLLRFLITITSLPIEPSTVPLSAIPRLTGLGLAFGLGDPNQKSAKMGSIQN